MLASYISCSFYYFCSLWSCGSLKLHVKFYCPSMYVYMYIFCREGFLVIKSMVYMYILVIYLFINPFFLWIYPVHQNFNNILRDLFWISSLLLITATFLDTIFISNWIYSYIFSVFLINFAMGFPFFFIILFLCSSAYLWNYIYFII